MPLVSVIIGTYNAECYIKETILSVLNQTFKDFELIVVDDGSTDKTIQIAEKLLNAPHKLIRQKNMGEAGARNTGLENASGKYIAFLDHDDLYAAEKLEKTVCFLEGNREFGMVYSNYDFIIAPRNINKWRGWSSSKSNNGSGDIFLKQFVENKIHIITVLLRRECFDKIGFFDQAINYACDSDMWIRISAHYKIGYLEDTLAYYRLHDTNVSLDRETCLIHRIDSMKKNYALFNDRVKGNKNIINSIKNLYYRIVKLYIKQGNLKKAFKYIIDYKKII
ncbi:glycosyltransferase [Candidatus Dependentiae bacterium]|nr:glycosyltransferase [Candidatus Dependentiae bacterium]